MVVSKDDELLDEESLARVKLISEKKRQLEETADQVRNDIEGCFARLAQALEGRERQLLRQVEAIHRQQLSLVQSKSELLPGASSDLRARLSDEQELLARLTSFGKIELANGIAVNDCEPYRAEEYLEAGEDVVSFDKSLQSDADGIDVSSVIRRKRDSSGKHTKSVVSINLDCAPRDARKSSSAASPAALAGPSRSLAAEVARGSPGRASDAPGENVFFEFGPEEASVESESGGGAERDASESRGSQRNHAPRALDKNTQHSIQIQQWLQKILTETETEPIIHEIGQFCSTPNSRLYREFPLET